MNNAQNTPGERIRVLEEQLARVMAEHQQVQRELTVMRALLLRQAGASPDHETGFAQRLALTEQAVRQNTAVVQEILGSRIWKTLQSGGGLLLNLHRAASRWRGNPQQKRIEGAERSGSQEIRLCCDTLPPEPENPVSGTIKIQGWAFAPDGVAKVEVSVASGEFWGAKYVSRPDVAKLFPDARKDALSGFETTFDTTTVSKGIHTITIRAHTKTGEAGELTVPIMVDQESSSGAEYRRWLRVFKPPEPELIQLQMFQWKYKPLISVLVPVFRTELRILQQMVDSVKQQSYEHWELCLVDDGSESLPLTERLEELATSDHRIRIAAQPQSGISAASNRALSLASGEYISLLDHDDMLTKDALFHVVSALQGEPRPDLLYSDEDHMDESGRRFDPFFKPDWSPDLILAENYVCHLMTFRRDLAIAAGGFRSEFDLSQDHDILLRLSRVAKHIHHIPQVLYHWRTDIRSMSRASHAEDRAIRSSRAVVEAHLRETKTDAFVEEGVYPGRWRIRYPLPANTTVSVLIPTAGKSDVLDRNLKALWAKAGKTPLEVVVIDNCKSQTETKVENYVKAQQAQGRPIRWFDQRALPFNYSAFNNQAANTCDSSLLLFLNDDTEAISEGFVDAMAELAARPETGAVGAKLLYPDGTIQHAGVTLGLAGVCGHSFKALPGDERHYFDFPDVVRNISAVTAACMMVRSDVFRQMHGFDAEKFPIAYNDIDLCLRIGKAGYRILYTPHALLYHYEAFSKPSSQMDPHPAETLAFKQRWRDLIQQDPFYNPHLTRDLENWSLRWR